VRTAGESARRSLRMMTLEESPDDNDEQRAQENHHRLDLRADVTVYAWHHDHPNSRTSIRTLLITLWLLRFVTTAGKTSRTTACWRAPRIQEYVIDATFARNDCAEGCIES